MAEKICPLISVGIRIAGSGASPYCVEARCAWWSEPRYGANGCAMLVVSERLDELSLRK
jgi:hypothetical protein